MMGGLTKIFKELVDKLPPEERASFEAQWEESSQGLFGDIAGKLQEMTSQLTESLGDMFNRDEEEDGEAAAEPLAANDQDSDLPPVEAQAAPEPAAEATWFMEREAAPEPQIVPHEMTHALQGAADANAEVQVVEYERHEATVEAIESMSAEADDGEPLIASEAEQQAGTAAGLTQTAEPDHADND